MKVLHINCNYLGTALHQLMIEKLDAQGVDNRVFVPTYNKNLAVIKPNESVFISECFKKRDRIFFDYKQKKMSDSITNHYDVKEFDIIHAYTLFTDGNCARNLSKRYDIPFVVAVRGTDVNDFFRLRYTLRMRGVSILRDASAVFFLSESYKRIVTKKYVPEKYREEILKKSYIIPNGIDDYWLHNVFVDKKKIDYSNIKLIYAGRINKNKNIPTILKSMEILRKKGIQSSLTVIGKIEDENEFKLIKQDPFVTYLGQLPKEELIKQYRNSDIFVMPSFSETFGLVYAEAMSQGLPVLYSKGQGFDNQFEEGRVGYHVISKNPNDVALKVLEILDNYTYIQKNVTKSVDRFCWSEITNRYKRIYKKVLNM